MEEIYKKELVEDGHFSFSAVESNFIKFVPTNPAPPVTKILFFFGIFIFYLLKI